MRIYNIPELKKVTEEDKFEPDGITGKNVLQKFSYSGVKILTGSYLSRRKLPLMAVESINPGPVVWLTGCIHGDEVGGIIVIQEIFKLLRKNPLLKGSIYAFPVMNPVGFETSSRSFILTEEDLNRVFPGKKNGTLAERIADKIFTTIKLTEPAVVLDLHNDSRDSIPYTLLDPLPEGTYDEVYEATKQLARQTGFYVVLDTEIEKAQKTLTYNLIKQNFPALTLELGEACVVNEENVRYGVTAVLNILEYFNMIVPVPGKFPYPVHPTLKDRILEYSEQPVSSTSGIIRFVVKPGDTIKDGKPVAKVYDPFGKLNEELFAFREGVFLGYSGSSVAFPGSPLGHFGLVQDPEPTPARS